MEGDIENARNSMEILEESSSEKHLEFYRSMAVFVHTLVECLQEKVSVEKICSESVTFIKSESCWPWLSNITAVIPKSFI